MNKTISLFFILPLLFSCSNPSGNPSEESKLSNETTHEITPSVTQEVSETPTDEVSQIPTEIPTEEPTIQPSITFEKKVDMTYTFKGDEKDKAGFAQGTIQITPTISKRNHGYYLIYFANNEKVLDNYDEVASIKITGESVSYDIKDGHYIPYEASKLAVFESDKMFLNNAPDISDAVDIIDIDENKKLELGELQYKLGVTSDVHMNFEGLGFGSLSKWDKTMGFFYNHKVDNVIITGDITGDDNLDEEYTYYLSAIEPFMDVNDVYESVGNHGNTPSTLDLFAKYTQGNDEVHPYENSPYYYVIKKAKNENSRDNMFIFLAQEIKGPSDSASYDNFSKDQIDWLEEVLKEYGTKDINIFLIEHSPFLNWSPGDRINGDYERKITFKESYTQTMRLKKLLETYKNIIMMTGHTHLTFYENENYSDQYDSFCRMVHVSSGTQTSSYNHGDRLISDTDGRHPNSPEYGSEGYIVEIYQDYIVYKGYNISTNKIIPQACLLIPTIAYGGSGGEVVDPTIKDVSEAKNFFEEVTGEGTLESPYLIENELHFKLLTDEFNKSTSTTTSQMFGYGQYFKQTKDLNMINFPSYSGTTASGSTRYTFAGNYNGNGHSINVNVSGGSNQSIFPYCYGVIANLKVTGNISGGTCAQVVRALYGKLINCIFKVNLNASQEAGAIYSNYGYVYNLYTTGTHSQNATTYALSSKHSSTKYYNVYYYRTIPGGLTISDSYGISSNNLNEIAGAFNNKNHSNYKEALSYLDGYEILDIIINNNELTFKVD